MKVVLRWLDKPRFSWGHVLGFIIGWLIVQVIR